MYRYTLINNDATSVTNYYTSKRQRKPKRQSRMEKSEKQAITNGKVRETGNIGYNTQIEDEKKHIKLKE